MKDLLTFVKVFIIAQIPITIAAILIICLGLLCNYGEWHQSIGITITSFTVLFEIVAISYAGHAASND